MRKFATGLAIFGICAVSTVAWSFQDHLACVKIKDSIPKGAYTIDTADQFFTGTTYLGCTLKTPAKTYCQIQTKLSVNPPPPGGGPIGPLLNVTSGAIAQGFFCYKVKCPKGPAFVFSTKDQFGARAIPPLVTSPKLYCAPASPSGAFLDDDSVF